MDYSMKNTNRHKMMAMGLPIKAAKGGMACAPVKKANGGAIADRQGRALAPGKMKKNLPMIAPQKAYAKGGKVVEKGSKEVYASKAAMKRHEAKESAAEEKAEHKKRGGMAKRSFRC